MLLYSRYGRVVRRIIKFAKNYHKVSLRNAIFSVFFTVQVGRFGQNFWLLWMIVVCEVLCNVKYILCSPAMMKRFQKPPDTVIHAWTGFFLIQLIYIVVHEMVRRKSGSYPRVLRMLKLGSFIPLLLLTKYYAY